MRSIKILAAATMIILFGAVPSHASCDFKTGESMGKLDAYEAISAMSIKTPNYTRWLEEVLNILISDSHTLNQSQKNWHRAKIDVEYKYGNCTHSAKIKLHGDLRDHLKYDGEVKSSLRVKMQDGNIGSAVGFKLFLPQTRNGINEILATMALRELGVLAPDTFFVDVKFNQLKVRYLFQEDISKEFLERNSRREGPIFEGDERFLWNSSGFDIQNQKHSLGRLTNERWAQKGLSALNLALRGYRDVQNGYLSYTSALRKDAIETYGLFDPYANTQNQTFLKFYVLMRAIGGVHATSPNNRKFYFDALRNQLEPIYYDGNVALYFENVYIDELELALNQIDEESLTRTQKAFMALRSNHDFIAEFHKKSKLPQDEAQAFIDKYTSIWVNNLSYFITLKNKSNTVQNFEHKSILGYVSSTKTNANAGEFFGIQGNVFEFDLLELSTLKSSPSTYRLENKDKLIELMTTKKSDRKFNYLIDFKKFSFGGPVKSQQLLGGTISYSEGVEIEISNEQRKITIFRKSHLGWALISNVSLNGWEIVSAGNLKVGNIITTNERQNLYGYTGCLTIYNSTLTNTNISALNSDCEDAVNFINVHAQNIYTVVKESVSDAVDFDFSKIENSKFEIFNAGNDCIDLSYGQYYLDSVEVTNCNDKGISIGENSSAHIAKVLAKNTLVGLAVKDLSEVHIDSFLASNSKVCIEAYQKKQEFGGARVHVSEFKCASQITQDKNSIIEISNHR